MATINTSTTDPISDWLSDFNTLAAFVGDTSGLSSGITDATSPDTLVTAINYIYTLAIASETTFADPVTFQDTLNVQGLATFEANATFNGNLTFNDTGSASVSIILDEDNMSSDSATALATQQSIKAYVDALSGSVDAGTLDTLNSTQFLRSDADDNVDNDIHLQFGDGTSGSIRIEHISANNATQFTPHNGTSFNVANNFGFDGDNGYWLFAGAMQVGGAFTSLGIDDNAASNVLQLETSSIALKQATTITGGLTLTNGDITLPDAIDTDITNGAGEFIRFDGSTSNAIEVYAGSVLGFDVTSTAVNLYYAGSVKLTTTSTGVSVTGDVVVSDDIFGPTSFDITNQAGEEINFTGTSLGFKVATSEVLGLTSGAATITGTLDVTSALSAGATTLSGNLTGGNTFTIDNSSTEKVRFTTTGIFLEVGDADILECASTGVNITGDLDVSGSITGTLGNISTGTIDSGAITATGLIQSNTGLTLNGGDITMPNVVAADFGNGAGETVRLNGSTTNTVQIFAGGIGNLQVEPNVVRLYYAGSNKLVTASGGITVTGAITASGDITGFSSDERLKNVVFHDIDTKSLDIVNCLKGKAYFWNENSLEINPSSDLDNVKFGLIAQEVEEVLPEIMGPEIEGYKTLRYEALIPVLINAINELSNKVKKLEG